MNTNQKKDDDKMKNLLVIFLVFGTLTCNYSQNKTIKGRVIDDDLEAMPGVSIVVNDTVEVGRTDLKGFFQVDIPACDKKILFESVGLYPTTIELVDKCDKIEVVMMLSGASDFITLRRAERKRKKRYEKLPDIHRQAFKKGIFETEHACYKREFEPFYLEKK